MTGSDCINFRLENIWESFWKYRKGKRKTREFYTFEYNVELNLLGIFDSIKNKTYKHGSYRTFIVHDNKKRQISEPQIRDKVVHRFIYDYLVNIYDKTFDFDVWSCREGKGLIAALKRTKIILYKNPDSFVWKGDISRFFDNIDHKILFDLVKRKVADDTILFVIKEIIKSFSIENNKGIPLGNLSSQIFANIYLNEFDRYVRHILKPDAYIRYGDDFIITMKDKNKLELLKVLAISFLNNFLKLEIRHNNLIIKVKHKLKFLGMRISTDLLILNKRNTKRIFHRLNNKNLSSYYGLIKQFGTKELQKKFKWKIFEILQKDKPSPTADNADYCSDC